MKTFPKIGKRGWGGVCVAAFAIHTIIQASWHDYLGDAWKEGQDHYLYVTALADGPEKYKEFMADRDRQSGAFFVLVGVGCVVSGYWKYGRKQKSVEQQKLETKQPEPAAQ